MKTIKVNDAGSALRELEAVLGFPLSGYVPGTAGKRMDSASMGRFEFCQITICVWRISLFAMLVN